MTDTPVTNLPQLLPYSSAVTTLNQDWTGSGTPSTAARLKLAMMLAGIPVTNNNAWANLIAQSNYEYPSGPVGNNLLGTSLVVNGSTSTNSDGVQSYQTWQDGVYAAAAMLRQSNMAPIYTSLYDNDDASAYADALANGSWEGDDPTDNFDYGQAFLARYDTLNAAGTLSSDMSGAEASSPGTLSPSGEAGQANPEEDLPSWASGLGNIIGDLEDGFGIGWKAVLTVIGGILLIGVAVVILLRKQGAQAAMMAA
jgi:hypothetical protein